MPAKYVTTKYSGGTNADTMPKDHTTASKVTTKKARMATEQ